MNLLAQVVHGLVTGQQVEVQPMLDEVERTSLDSMQATLRQPPMVLAAQLSGDPEGALLWMAGPEPPGPT
jgi:hypothetical protein